MIRLQFKISMVIASAAARMMPDKQKKSPELAAYTLAVEAHRFVLSAPRPYSACRRDPDCMR
jgi:hypothetical protein